MKYQLFPEGVNLAESAKMQTKPVSEELMKQQKEIEEQKKLLLKQQEDVRYFIRYIYDVSKNNFICFISLDFTSYKVELLKYSYTMLRIKDKKCN